jgi:hypothetical protein
VVLVIFIIKLLKFILIFPLPLSYPDTAKFVF